MHVESCVVQGGSNLFMCMAWEASNGSPGIFFQSTFSTGSVTILSVSLGDHLGPGAMMTWYVVQCRNISAVIWLPRCPFASGNLHESLGSCILKSEHHAAYLNLCSRLGSINRSETPVVWCRFSPVTAPAAVAGAAAARAIHPPRSGES